MEGGKVKEGREERKLVALFPLRMQGWDLGAHSALLPIATRRSAHLQSDTSHRQRGGERCQGGSTGGASMGGLVPRTASCLRAGLRVPMTPGRKADREVDVE